MTKDKGLLKYGEALLAARTAAGISQTDLANKVGFLMKVSTSQNTISKVERGIMRPPDNVRRVVEKLFGITCDCPVCGEFWYEKGEKK